MQCAENKNPIVCILQYLLRFYHGMLVFLQIKNNARQLTENVNYLSKMMLKPYK